MSTAKKSIKTAAPEWVSDATQWEAFVYHNFGTAQDAADLYGCIGSVLIKLFDTAVNASDGMDLQAEHSWAISRMLTMQRGLGMALGVLDDAGGVVPMLVESGKLANQSLK